MSDFVQVLDTMRKKYVYIRKQDIRVIVPSFHEDRDGQLYTISMPEDMNEARLKLIAFDLIDIYGYTYSLSHPETIAYFDLESFGENSLAHTKQIGLV